MKILPDVYYKVIQSTTNQVLDGNGSGTVYGLAWNGGDYQRWMFELQREGEYKILQKATGRVLDGDPGGKVYTLPWNGGEYQRWYLQPTEDGSFILKHKATGYFLGSNLSGGLSLSHRGQIDQARWSIEFAATQCHFMNAVIVYETNQYPGNTYPVYLIMNEVWQNNSPARISETITRSITRTHTYEWRLIETLSTEASLSLTADIPLLGSATSEAGIRLGLSTQQSYRSTVSETYTVSRTITLEERSAIKVSAYVDWAENFRTRFILKMYVSIAVDSRLDGEYLLHTEQIRQHLEAIGFDGEIVKDVGCNHLLIGLRGNFTGSYGMTTHMIIDEIPLKKTGA